jgi:hypothetical protein
MTRFSLARLARRAVLHDEHDALVAVKGSPLTWSPPDKPRRPHATPDNDPTWFGIICKEKQ